MMLCNNVLTVLQCCFLGSYCKGSWSSSGRLWHINISWHEMKRQEIRSVLALPLSSEWRCDVDSFIAVPGMFWSSFQVIIGPFCVMDRTACVVPKNMLWLASTNRFILYEASCESKVWNYHSPLYDVGYFVFVSIHDGFLSVLSVI